MGSISTDSSGLRAIEVARIAASPNAARVATEKDAPVAEGSRESAVQPATNGVPRRIAVPQQLPPNTRLHIDKESNRVVAQVLDENNEVVRQIPPEALLELSTTLDRLEGLLFNKEL